MILNDQQEKIVKKAVDWFYNSSEQAFQYSGSAGTGKSVVMNAIIQALGLDITEVAPMSFIGAAVIVMRRKGLINAKTVHSWLYELKWEDSNEMDGYLNRHMKKMVFVILLCGVLILTMTGCVKTKNKLGIMKNIS